MVYLDASLPKSPGSISIRPEAALEILPKDESIWSWTDLNYGLQDLHVQLFKNQIFIIIICVHHSDMSTVHYG